MDVDTRNPARRTIFLCILLVPIFFIACTRDTSMNTPQPLLHSDYFPLKLGHTWHYHVKHNEHISTPPFRNIWHIGAEQWTLLQKNDADSSLVFDISFTGIKISIDTSGVADTTFDQIFSAELPVYLIDGRLENVGQVEHPVFFDDWLNSVDFQMHFPDSSNQALRIYSDDFSNTQWHYSIERNIGLVSGEWIQHAIFGSFYLEYLLFQND